MPISNTNERRKFNVLDFVTKNSGEIEAGLDLASGFTGAFSTLAAPAFAKSIISKQSKLNNRIAEINASRIDREMRVRMANNRVQNAASGNSESGSYVFAAADNARQAEEHRQNELLKAELTNINLRSSKPSGLEAGIGFGSQLFSTLARQASRREGEF